MAKATQCSNKTSNAASPSPAFNIGHLKRSLPGSFSSQRNVSVAAKHRENAEPMARALSGDMTTEAPFLEPFFRTFVLGVGTGALLEGGHVALQVLAGSFPGVSQYSPLIVADHVTAFASWIALYAIEAVAIMAVLQRNDWKSGAAAAEEIRSLTTLPKKMFPIRSHIFKNLMKAGKTMTKKTVEISKTTNTEVFNDAAEMVVDVEAEVPAAPAALPLVNAAASLSSTDGSVVEAPVAREASRMARSTGVGSILPRKPPSPRKPTPGGGDEEENPHAAQYAKRAKELRDREGYLKNVWYAAAISDNVGNKPHKIQLCGKEMVLWRDQKTGAVHCIDNACPHRGAPLSSGWVSEKEGHSCISCGYHGWAFDGKGSLHDVPAAANKGEWPKRSLMDAYPVVEKGGFIWLFYGSTKLPEDARPPIPVIPELEDPTWKPVFEEMEFEANHFGVFENAIDMAHIHYLHNDSFGNQEAPEIRDMEATSDAYSVTAKFKIQNKPVNAFWALFKVPVVEVTATAYLPSTSVVSFTLANGLSFITFVNTVPISATRSINRFSLIRKISWDKTGLFNARAWDGMARKAMIKIQTEDKAMLEQLKYDQLPAEFSVRADLPQVQFRKLRQQWAEMVGVVPTELERPPYTVSNKDM